MQRSITQVGLRPESFPEARQRIRRYQIPWRSSIKWVRNQFGNLERRRSFLARPTEETLVWGL